MFKGIIAMDDARTIGKDNDLPWPKQNGDLSFFKEKTWGDNVIFGRKTFQGLGRTCLPNRKIYVMTNFNPYGWSYSEINFSGGKGETRIIQHESDLPAEDFWVCGGKAIYNLFLPKMTECFVTYIKGVFDGNVKMNYFENQFPYQKEIAQTENYRTVWFWK
jgi:dihydrofolate reductase